MTILDQARKYLDKIPSAVSGNGGHNQTYRVAIVLVQEFGLSILEARPLMLEYSARCDPPWSDYEVDHKLSDADKVIDPKGRGWRVAKSVRYRFNGESTPQPSPTPSRTKSATVRRYGITGEVNLPAPIADGARTLIKTAFFPGEGIAIVIGEDKPNGDGERPKLKADLVLSYEEWLRKLDGYAGDPNKFWKTSSRNGIYIRVNPIKLGGSKDEDVTAFRHTLLEFDRISIAEQWNLIEKSRIPCSVVISSGGKSIHAWVKVDAVSRREYDERVKLLHNHFDGHIERDESGKAKDRVAANKNPSRWSRFANCCRGEARQELLAVNIGAESFSTWAANLETEGFGRVHSIKKLRRFDTSVDPDNLLGARWICRKGKFLLVGQSGLGKSSFMAQAAITWAMGRSFFGIAPTKPLKSLIIQAENDEGDLAEMVQGVMTGLAVDMDSEAEDVIDRNVIPITEGTHTGERFCHAVQKQIDKYRPDLVWFDPLLSFIGDDISKQAVCSAFLRNWLGPIAEASGVAWMMIHHTGKPSADPRARSEWKSTDYSYSGIGSSELTNWARAVCVIQRVDEETFELKLTKRGKRAGATSLEGMPATSLWLSHAASGIRWDQVKEPEKKGRYTANKEGEDKLETDEPKKAGAPKKEFDFDGFLKNIKGEYLTVTALASRAAKFGGFSVMKFYGQEGREGIWTTLKPMLNYDQEAKRWTI